MREHLETYLNDHLAGAAMAVELLARLETDYAGSYLEQFFRQLRVDVASDRVELVALMKQMELVESAPRRWFGQLSEKVALLKLRLDDPHGESLRLLEALELIALGIDGKRALWRALTVLSEERRLTDIDFRRLDERAAEQRSRVEIERLQAARLALG